jgi:hypothetical protein
MTTAMILAIINHLVLKMEAACFSETLVPTNTSEHYPSDNCGKMRSMFRDKQVNYKREESNMSDSNDEKIL